MSNALKNVVIFVATTPVTNKSFSEKPFSFSLATSLAKPLMPPKTRVVLREGNSPTAFLADVARQSPARAKVYQKAYQFIYGFADSIICQSEFMRENRKRNKQIPGHKLHRI